MKIYTSRSSLEYPIKKCTVVNPLGQIPSERLLKFENYYRGALFVHGMRQAMGDDDFFSGLRLYLARFADRSASDIEFRAAMEEAAGNSLEAVWAAGFAR